MGHSCGSSTEVFGGEIASPTGIGARFCSTSLHRESSDGGGETRPLHKTVFVSEFSP
jgi:hypothetical protein